MIISSFLPRAIAVFLIVQVPVWALADALAPAASSFAYEGTADKVAEKISGSKDRSAKHFSEIAQQYNLAWVHLTDKSGKGAVSSSGPHSVPESGGEGSRVIEKNGLRFVELSRTIGKSDLVRVGFRCPGLFDALFVNQLWPVELPLGTFFIALSLNALAMLAAYLAFLGMPLYKLLGKLGPGQDISDGYPPYVASELAAISDGVKQRFSSLKEDHEKNLSAARSDLSGQFVKEVEDRFINKLANELVTMTKSDVVYDLIIHRLKDEFIGVIKYAFGFEFIQSEENQYQILHQWNLSDENLKVLEGLANSQFSVLAKKLNNPVLLSKDELASKRLEQLITDLGCDQALVIPMDLQRKEKAYICFFMVNKDQQTMQKLERIAMRISEQVSPLWQLVARYEEAYKLSRHDALTSLKNRVSLEEKLQQWNVVASEDGKSESVFLVFEGDNFRVMLNSYGPRTIDRLIQELAEQIVASLEQAVRFKKASSRIDFAKYMYRVGGCRFLLILEDSSLKKALELAEQVSQSVAERRDWAHGLPSWSVSCGVSALVPGKTTPEDTFEEATITLEHIRSRKSTALVMQSSEVPEEFMSRAQSRNRSDVENIEPAALLQQLSQSKKTGILTVSDAGKIFWAYIENGYPTKARLGKLCGDEAVVDFISSFVRITYRLQDLSTLDAQTSSDMRSLGGAYIIQMPIKELIDFSIITRDSGADARVHLKTPDMIVHPTTDKQAGQLEQVFFKIGKTPNRIYLEVANRVWDLCNGRFTLDEVVSKLETENPQALIWSAADFLMQQKLIKFSRLRVSAYTDGSSDKDIAASAASRNAAGGVAATATQAPPSNTGFVAVPRACVACKKQDPLSQKFCVHCGTEMPEPIRD